MAKKEKQDQVESKETVQVAEKTVIIFKANRPMTEREHTSLSRKLRQEHEESGIPIILQPYSVDKQVGEDGGGK